MTSTWGRCIALGAAALLLVPQVEAQRARELGMHAVFTAQEPELFAGGVYGGVRTTRRTRRTRRTSGPAYWPERWTQPSTGGS